MVAKGIVAFLIINSLFSAGFGWMAYYVGIATDTAVYVGWDAFWLIGGAVFIGDTILVLFCALCVALIDWVIG
jgi:hypothetical protein